MALGPNSVSFFSHSDPHVSNSLSTFTNTQDWVRKTADALSPEVGPLCQVVNVCSPVLDPHRRLADRFA
jgi:hypothetical protein